MRSRPLPAAGALLAALLLAGCTQTTAGQATPRADDGPRAIPTPSVRPDVGTVPLPGSPTENGGAALLGSQGDDEVVGVLRRPSDEGGYLGTVVSLGLLTPDGPGTSPGEPEVLDEAVVPMVGDAVIPRAVAAVPGGGVVTAVDLVLPGGDDDSSAVLTRWGAALVPVGEELELAPDEEVYSTTHQVAVLDDGTAVAAVSTGRVAGAELRLVAVAGDVVSTVAELPDAIDPGGLAVDRAGGSAYLAVRERGSASAVLVLADVAAGTTDTVDLCRFGAVDDVAVAADGGAVWVSGVCDDQAVVWAVS